MNKQQLLRQDRLEVANECFDGQCIACKKEVEKIVFQFHHLWYYPGELAYLKSIKDKRELKWKFTKVAIMAEPTRFICLCRFHHSLVAMYTRSESGKHTIMRLLMVILLTKVQYGRTRI